MAKASCNILMAPYTLDSGKMIRCRDLGSSNTPTMIYMRVNSSMELLTDSASTCTSVVIYTKDSGIITNHMAKEKRLMPRGVFMLVIIRMETCMAMESISGLTDRFIKGNF